MRIAARDVKHQLSPTGEAEALVWQNIVFKWARHAYGFDEYDALGFFLGFKAGFIYQDLTLIVDTQKGYKLRLGKAYPYQKVKLLDL